MQAVPAELHIRQFGVTVEQERHVDVALEKKKLAIQLVQTVAEMHWTQGATQAGAIKVELSKKPAEGRQEVPLKYLLLLEEQEVHSRALVHVEHEYRQAGHEKVVLLVK